MIIKNPLLGVNLPKIKKTSAEDYQVLSRPDIEKIVKAAEEDISNFIYVFAVFSGLRRGEILALTHADIDFENNVIKVSKSLTHLMADGKYRAVVASAKTAGSVREVPILSSIKPGLEAHIAVEREKHRKLGAPFTDASIVFSSSACGYRDGRNLLRGLKRLQARLGIKETKFHALRHTFCTLLCEQDIPLKTASVLMGHASIKMTSEIYTHVNMREQKRGIEKLAAIFG